MKISKLMFMMILVFGLGMISCNNTTNKEEQENLSEEMMNEMDKTNTDKVKNTATSTMKEKKEIYNMTQVDMPPLFDNDCLTQSDPTMCSEKKMFSFIKDNIKVPNEVRNGNAESFEQVIVVVNEDGSLSDMKYIASSDNESCKTCQQAAADVVGMMENWKPAMKDGKPVPVQMTIPIRFNI